MKKNLPLFVLTVAMLLAGSVLFAQSNAISDFRFVQHSLNCADSSLLVTIEVKSPTNPNRYEITSQNYRFSIPNGNAVELDDSVFPINLLPTSPLPINLFYGMDGVQPNGTKSAYQGSVVDSIVSFNVAYSGPGDPFIQLVEENWVGIACLTFKLKNANECFEFDWHEQAVFPPTVVTEWIDPANQPLVAEGVYENYTACTNILCPDVFPVELLSFDAELEGNDGRLIWVTASELNNDRFEVYRSLDGENFDFFVGKVNAVGNSNTETQYTLLDPNVVALQSEKVYYQLRQIDLDGTSRTFDDAVEIRLSGAVDEIILSLYPNPAQNVVNLEYISNKNEYLQVQIFNAAGQLVLSQELDVEGGVNQKELNIETLTSGIYYVNVFNEETTVTKKLMVE